MLDLAGITLNRNQIPDDPRSPFVTSGLRLGTAAETTAGMGDDEMRQIASLIARSLRGRDDEATSRRGVRAEVTALCAAFAPYPDGGAARADGRRRLVRRRRRGRGDHDRGADACPRAIDRAQGRLRLRAERPVRAPAHHARTAGASRCSPGCASRWPSARSSPQLHGPLRRPPTSRSASCSPRGVILVVGLVDDMRSMSAPAKVAGEVLAACVLYFAGVTM